jgi:hypothetical protein
VANGAVNTMQARFARVQFGGGRRFAASPMVHEQRGKAALPTRCSFSS